MREVATASTDWIDLGDRSHPNLKIVDKLKRELTYDGHKNDLKELEQAHFGFGCGLSFDSIHNRVRRKEKMSRGDRSHPNLVRLDELIKNVTYEGWRDDFHKAEKDHVHSPLFFYSDLKAIERKQKISVGDRSDKDLIFLDSLRLSYPGWKRDWDSAFDYYKQGTDFDSLRIKFSLSEKQRMYNGDRSNPRLVALDSLKLTYPGWEKDVKEYETKHLRWGIGGFEFLGEADARKERAILRCKQKKYVSGIDNLSWMAPKQRTIVNTRWTFPGWEEAVQKVREMTSKNFGDALEHFQVRQMIHDDDYNHHPLLIELKSMKLSYPSWEEDFFLTKRQLKRDYFWKVTLESNIQGMRKKQTVYDGYVRSLRKKSKPKSMSKQKDEEEKGLKECVVCWVAPRTHVFVPCGHMCACKSCSSRLMESRKICPTCNQSSTMAIEVFLP